MLFLSAPSRFGVPFSCFVITCLLLAGCGSGNPSSSMPIAAQPGPADQDAPTEFTVTASGLKYRILRKGGGVKPELSDLVEVHFRGWLDNGVEFDNSYTRGKPLTIKLGSTLAGWAEGLSLLSKGGMIEMELPSSLGYGKTGSGDDVPPYAVLHFKVELLRVLVVQPGLGKVDKS